MYGPRTLLDAVYEPGRKGISMQRYKGLGEMNPEQLWETTLNRDVRTLLQVKIGDLGEADEIFSRLMGDIVEPRREFIQANALAASVRRLSLPRGDRSSMRAKRRSMPKWAARGQLMSAPFVSVR